MSLPENTTYNQGPSIPKFTGALGGLAPKLNIDTQKTQSTPMLTKPTEDMLRKSSNAVDIFSSNDNITPSFISPIEEIDTTYKPVISDLSIYDPIQRQKVQIDEDTYNNLDIKVDPITNTRYYEDKRDPNKIITETRKNSYEMRYNERQGLSSRDAEIDHIIPLWLGGEDTPANKQRLSVVQHAAKTKIDSILQELVYNKTISPSQARAMYGKWQDLDTTGVYLDSNNNNQIVLTDYQAKKYGTDNANDYNARQQFTKDIYNAWQINKKPEIKFTLDRFRREGFNDLIENTFGEAKTGKPTVADDLIKSFVSGVSNGWIHNIQDDNDRDLAATVANITGGATGTISNLLLESAAMTAAGAAVGSLAGPVGTFVGGLTGLGVGLFKGIKTAKTAVNAIDKASDVAKLLKSTDKAIDAISAAKKLRETSKVATNVTKGLNTLSKGLKFVGGARDVNNLGNLTVGVATSDLAKEALSGGAAIQKFTNILKNSTGLKIKPSSVSQIMANVPLFLTQGMTGESFWDGDTTTKFKIATASALNGLIAGAFDPISKPLGDVANKTISKWGSSTMNNYLGDAVSSFAVGLFESDGDVKAAAQNALVGSAFQLFTHGQAQFSGRLKEATNHIKNLEISYADKILSSAGIKLDFTPKELKNKVLVEQKLTEAYAVANQRAIKAINEGVPETDVELDLIKVTAALQTKYRQTLSPEELAQFNSENAKSIGKILQSDFENNNPISFYVPGKPDVEQFINANWSEFAPSSLKYANDASVSKSQQNTNNSLASTLRAMDAIKRGGKAGTITGQGVGSESFKNAGFNPYMRNIEILSKIPNEQIGDKILLHVDDSPITQKAIKEQNTKVLKENQAIADKIQVLQQAIDTKLSKLDPLKPIDEPRVTKMQKELKDLQDVYDANNAKITSQREKAIKIYAMVYDGVVNGRLQLTPKVLEIGYVPISANIKSKEGLDYYAQKDYGASIIKDDLNNQRIYDSIKKTGGNFMVADLLGKPEIKNGKGFATWVLPKDYDKQHAIYNRNYDNVLTKTQLSGITKGGIQDFVETTNMLGIESRTEQLDLTLTKMQNIFEADMPAKSKISELRKISTIFDDIKTANSFIKKIDNLTVQDLIKVLDNKLSTTQSINTKDTRIINDASLYRELNNVFSSGKLYNKDGSLNKSGKALLRMPLISRVSKNKIDTLKVKAKTAITSPEKVANYNKVKNQAIEIERNKDLSPKDSINPVKEPLVQATIHNAIVKKVKNKEVDVEDIAKSKMISNEDLTLMKTSTDPEVKKVGNDIDAERKELERLDDYEPKDYKQIIAEVAPKIIAKKTSTQPKKQADLLSIIPKKASEEGISGAPKKQADLLSIIPKKASEEGISGAPKKQTVETKPKTEVENKDNITTKVEEIEEDYIIPERSETNKYLDRATDIVKNADDLKSLEIKNLKSDIISKFKENQELDPEDFAKGYMDNILANNTEITPKDARFLSNKLKQIYNKTVSSKEALEGKGVVKVGVKQYIQEDDVTPWGNPTTINVPEFGKVVVEKYKPTTPLNEFAYNNKKYKDEGVYFTQFEKNDKSVALDKGRTSIYDIKKYGKTVLEEARKKGLLPIGSTGAIEDTVFVRMPKTWRGQKFNINNPNHVAIFYKDLFKDMQLENLDAGALRKRINLLNNQDPKGNSKDNIRIIEIDSDKIKDIANLNGALYMDKRDMKATAKYMGIPNPESLKPVVASDGVLVKGQVSPIDNNFIKVIEKKLGGKLSQYIKQSRADGYKVVLSVNDNIKVGSDKFLDDNGFKVLDLTGDKFRWKIKEDGLEGNIGDKSFGMAIFNKINKEDKKIFKSFINLFKEDLDTLFDLLYQVESDPGKAWELLQNSKFAKNVNPDKLYGVFSDLVKAGGDISTLDKRFATVVASIMKDIAANPIKRSSYSPIIPDTGVWKFKDGTTGKLKQGEIAMSSKHAEKLGIKDGESIGAIRYPLTTKRAISDLKVRIVDDKGFGSMMGKNIALNEKDVFDIFEGDFDGDHLSLFNYKDNKDLESIVKHISSLKKQYPINKISLSEADKVAKKGVSYDNIVDGIIETAIGKQAVGTISNDIGIANVLITNNTPITIDGKTYTPEFNDKIDDEWRYILQAAVDAQKYNTLYKLQDTPWKADPIAIAYGITGKPLYDKFKNSDIYTKAKKGTDMGGKVLSLVGMKKESITTFKDLEKVFNIEKLPINKGGNKHPIQILTDYIEKKLPKFSAKLTEDTKKKVFVGSKNIFTEDYDKMLNNVKLNKINTTKVFNVVEKAHKSYNVNRKKNKETAQKTLNKELDKVFSYYNKLSSKEKEFISLGAITRKYMNKSYWEGKTEGKFYEPVWELILPKHKKKYFEKASETLKEEFSKTTKKETI